jgi:acetyltransferase-like isoleucine patch superfamily enzyme
MYHPPGRISISVIKHRLATTGGVHARALRRLHRGLTTLSVPVPTAMARLVLWGYLAARSTYHFGKRVLVCQPLFEAYCERVGAGLQTGCFLHWVQGDGDILIGDNVLLDGQSTITFAATFSDRPTLEIGDNTSIGHATDLTIGKRITIGKNCHISGASRIFDSSGHPTDTDARRAGEPPPAKLVRPVTIEDDAWVGKHSIVFPGVTIGEGAIVSAGSVVREDVPPFAIVAGNPAQVVYRRPSIALSAAAPAVTPANGARPHIVGALG